MPTSMDNLAPDYLGEDRIGVTLHQGQTPSAFAFVTLDVDYSECLPEGVVLPLEMIVRGPSESSYQRRIYSRYAPQQLVFKPREGGSHYVMLREVAHNRYWGRINLNVAGEALSVAGMP